MRMLVWALAGRTYHIVGNLMPRLIHTKLHNKQIKIRALLYRFYYPNIRSTCTPHRHMPFNNLNVVLQFEGITSIYRLIQHFSIFTLKSLMRGIQNETSHKLDQWSTAQSVQTFTGVIVGTIQKVQPAAIHLQCSQSSIEKLSEFRICYSYTSSFFWKKNKNKQHN